MSFTSICMQLALLFIRSYTIVIRLNLYVIIIIYHAVNHSYETREKKAPEPCAMTSHTITFNYHCTSFYASHLWSKYLCSSLNHLRVAYNDSFRLIHWLKRNVSERELQVKANIPTFDALQRKLIYRFIERCCLSSNVYVNYTVYSNFFYQSDYYKHCLQLLM